MSVAADLYLWETLVALRLPFSLRAFRHGVTCVSVVAGLVVWTLAALVAGVLIDMGDPRLSLAVIAVTLLSLTYLAVVHFARDALTNTNPVHPDDPRHGLLKALDLHMPAVALVFTGVPRLPLTVVGTGAVLALALPLSGQVGLTRWDLSAAAATPVLLGAAGTVAAATAATTGRRIGLPRLHTLLVMGTGSVVLGIATARLVEGLLAERSSNVVNPATVIGWLLPQAVMLLVAAVGGCMALARSRLRYGPSESAPRAARARVAARPTMVGSLLAEVTRATTFPVVRNTIVGSGCALLCLLGAVWAGLDLEELASPKVRFALTGIIATMVLALCEALSRPVGPIRLAATSRTLWELGANSRRIAATLLACYLVPISLSAALTSGAFWAVTHRFSLMPALAHLVGLAAWVVAECLVPPLTNADGSALHNAVTGVTILALSSPVFVAAFQWSASATSLLAVYSLILTGGAFECLSRRVLTMPSTYAP